MVNTQQRIKQLEQQQAENRTQAAILTQQADNASDNATANKLYAQAEALKITNSKLAGQIEQVDLRSRDVLRDMKKIGPDLKEIREKLNKNWIPVWIHKPTDFRPTTKMPNFRLTDDQVKAISALPGAMPPNRSALPKGKPGNAARGKELFETPRLSRVSLDRRRLRHAGW